MDLPPWGPPLKAFLGFFKLHTTDILGFFVEEEDAP